MGNLQLTGKRWPDRVQPETHTCTGVEQSLGQSWGPRGMCGREEWDPRWGSQEVPAGVWNLRWEAQDSHICCLDESEIPGRLPTGYLPIFIPLFSKSLVSDHHMLRQEGRVVGNKLNALSLPFQRAVQTIHSIFIVKSIKIIQKHSRNFVFLLKQTILV